MSFTLKTLGLLCALILAIACVTNVKAQLFSVTGSFDDAACTKPTSLLVSQSATCVNSTCTKGGSSYNKFDCAGSIDYVANLYPATVTSTYFSSAGCPSIGSKALVYNFGTCGSLPQSNSKYFILAKSCSDIAVYSDVGCSTLLSKITVGSCSNSFSSKGESYYFQFKNGATSLARHFGVYLVLLVIIGFVSF